MKRDHLLSLKELGEKGPFVVVERTWGKRLLLALKGLWEERLLLALKALCEKRPFVVMG